MKVFILILMILVCGSISAKTFHFKDGSTIGGKIVSKDNTSITIEDERGVTHKFATTDVTDDIRASAFQGYGVYYKVINESGSTNELNKYDTVGLGWLDLGEEKYTNYGYTQRNRNDWDALIKRLNVRQIAVFFNHFNYLDYIADKDIKTPLNETNDSQTNNGLVIQFSNADFIKNPKDPFSSSYDGPILSVIIHFIDGKTGKELYNCTINTIAYSENSYPLKFEYKVEGTIYNVVRFIVDKVKNNNVDSNVIQQYDYFKDKYKIIKQTKPNNNLNQYNEIYVGWLDLAKEKYLKYDYDENNKNEWYQLVEDENQQSMPKYLTNFIRNKKIVTAKKIDEPSATNGLVIKFTDVDFKEESAIVNGNVVLDSLCLSVHFIDGVSGKEVYKSKLFITSRSVANDFAFSGHGGGGFGFSFRPGMNFDAQVENCIYNLAEYISIIVNKK